MAAVDGLENALTKKAEASSLQYFAVKDGSNITETESWKNKLGVNLLDAVKANKDASGLSAQHIEAWKSMLGVGEIPENMATNDGEDDDGNPVSGTSYTKEQSDGKYYPKVSSQYFNANYVLLADGTPKAAGDLGKNVANSSLTSIAGAGLILGAPWTMNTAGQNYAVTGLNDVSANSAFSVLLTQNAAGQVGKSNGKQPFINMPSLLSDAEKTAWKTSMNGGWTTNTMSVGLIYPAIVPRSANPGNLTFITLIGSNLNLNPGNFTVRIINAAGAVVETVNNSKVTLLNANMLNFSFDSNTYSNGDYKVKLWNGVAEYITPLTFSVMDNTAVTQVDISGNTWSRVTAGNLSFDKEFVKNYNELSVGFDEDLYNYAGQNFNAVLVAYYMQSFLTTADNFTIEGIINKTGGNYNPFGGSTGFGITTSAADGLSAERISGAATTWNNNPTHATFLTGGTGSVNLLNSDSMKFIIAKKANFVTTALYKDDGSISIATSVIDNTQAVPVRFKIFTTAFQYDTQAIFGVKISGIKKM